MNPGGLAVFVPGFALGVWLLQRAPDLPPAWLLLAVLAATGLGWRHWRAARVLAPLVLGLAWSWLHAWWALQGALPATLEGRDLTVSGWIQDLPRPVAGGERFLMALDRVSDASGGLAWRGRVRLSWYGTPPPLHAGERWRLRVRLKAPHGYADPGGFDYEGWLFGRGIRATGYVRPGGAPQRLQVRTWSLDRWRQGLRAHLEAAPVPAAASGLIVALTLGDRGGIDRDHWRALTRTGTNHLVAISGLHVGIMASLAFFLMRAAWRRATRACQALAAERAGALAGLTAGLGYAALAGFSVSTQRALTMLALVFAAVLLRRALRPGTGLLAALLLVLLLDPFACLAPGFWLSFGAVAVLLFGMTRRPGARGLLWRWGRAQWLVALGLLPLLWLLFGRVSPAAPLVNLVAVPLFSLVLLPMVLAAALAALATSWYAPLVAVAWLLERGLDGLGWVAAQPWAVWYLPQPPAWGWPAAVLGTLLLLAPRGLPVRWAGLGLLLPLLAARSPVPPEGAFRFTLLDVGQGLAAVVRTHAHVLVYDTGPRYPSGFNAGTAVLAPFLESRGVRRVDRVVVSHGDQDHAGGLQGLLAEVPALRISSGEPYALGPVQAEACRAGQHWTWDGVHFQVLHPRPPLAPEANNRSCVLRVDNRAGAVLLTGDAERSVERDLVRRWGPAGLRSRVLVAGHHGSASSTSTALLAAVQPDWVLYSAGYRNRFGFPRPQVRSRVRRAGAAEADTVHGGALELVFGADGRLRGPYAWRERARHYWSHRPHGE